MAQTIVAPASAAAEALAIHEAACRYRRQGLACSACSDLSERAARATVSTVVDTAPTASQWASAACHLERREDWRTVRIFGVRYVVLASGRSGKVYMARADAAGCSCPWYERTARQCSHMLALELAALESELISTAEFRTESVRKAA